MAEHGTATINDGEPEPQQNEHQNNNNDKKKDKNSDPELFCCLLQPLTADADPQYIGIRRLLLHRKAEAGVLRRRVSSVTNIRSYHYLQELCHSNLKIEIVVMLLALFSFVISFFSVLLAFFSYIFFRDQLC